MCCNVSAEREYLMRLLEAKNVLFLPLYGISPHSLVCVRVVVTIGANHSQFPVNPMKKKKKNMAKCRTRIFFII